MLVLPITFSELPITKAESFDKYSLPTVHLNRMLGTGCCVNANDAAICFSFPRKTLLYSFPHYWSPSRLHYSCACCVFHRRRLFFTYIILTFAHFYPEPYLLPRVFYWYCKSPPPCRFSRSVICFQFSPGRAPKNLKKNCHHVFANKDSLPLKERRAH